MLNKTMDSTLHDLGILPFSNNNWKTFSVHLRSDSEPMDYEEAKNSIRENTPKGVGGVYVITKRDKVLYIGESQKNIRRRLNRHIDKIYVRNDARSDFFKLPDHHGELSIYYLNLPMQLIHLRKPLEDLLTYILEPEYKKWDLKNKLYQLEECMKEYDNEIIQERDREIY